MTLAGGRGITNHSFREEFIVKIITYLKILNVIFSSIVTEFEFLLRLYLANANCLAE